MNLNKAMLIGNLTRDPEMRTTPNGTSVTSFAVATNYVWNDQSGVRQEKAEYHNVVAWRKLAEICGQYLHKGSKVYIEGRLQTRNWEDQTGNKRYMTEIIADNMIMLDSKGASGGAGKQSAAPANPAASSASEEAPPIIDVEEPTSSKSNEVKVDDVPF